MIGWPFPVQGRRLQRLKVKLTYVYLQGRGRYAAEIFLLESNKIKGQAYLWKAC